MGINPEKITIFHVIIMYKYYIRKITNTIKNHGILTYIVVDVKNPDVLTYFCYEPLRCGIPYTSLCAFNQVQFGCLQQSE